MIKPRKKKTESQKLRDECDDLMREIIRKVSGNICRRCGKYHERIEWAHFIPRKYLKVRWERDNCAPLCGGCHQYLDNFSMEKDEFFYGLIGTARAFELNRIARSTSYKVDKEQIKHDLEEKLKLLEA